jgi:hypothetical protein
LGSADGCKTGSGIGRIVLSPATMKFIAPFGPN